MSLIGKNLERFKMAINAHDRENPDHSPAFGIGMSLFDLERMGFDDGEELWPGVKIHVVNCTTGNFKVMCGREHVPPVKAVAREAELTPA